MGIDRFQRARDTGSIYAWVSQTNDPFHYTYEPHQWNAEFEPEIRMQDSGIEVVTLTISIDMPVGGEQITIRTGMRPSHYQRIYHRTTHSKCFMNMPAMSEQIGIKRAMEATVDVMNGIISHICTFVMQTIHRFVVLNSCAGLQRMDVKGDG